MKGREISLLLLSVSFAAALNVMSMNDGVTLRVNEYVEIQNFMDTTVPLVDSQAEINQVL